MKFSEWLEIQEGKKDACYHKVKAKMAVWPSAYGSGLLVQCRKKGAKNWGNKSKKKKRKKHEDQFSSENIKSENRLITFENFMESKFEKEKNQGLHGWFSRKTGGWIDCKASKKGHLVPCGRKKAGRGAERAYPACRPTLSACTAKGKKRKKSSKRISWE
jgi:hypothetical protein